MSEQEKISQLKEHIQSLEKEISAIDIKRPKLSAEMYAEEKAKLFALQNLCAIAKNELNSLLHQYRFTLKGYVVNAKGTVAERIIRTRVYSDIDCTIVSPATITGNRELAQPLLELVMRDAKPFFVEGKFEIKRIKKLR